MSAPRLLDLFCGAGGAGMGYHRAGFDVTGVDVAPQKRYPFAFVQADALEYVREHGHEFDAIHASPPCQAYCSLGFLNPHKTYPDLVAETRDALVASGSPFVIENVPRAPLRTTIALCGTMFGLRVYRHRHFESSHLLMQPSHPRHTVKSGGMKSQRERKAIYEAGGFVTITGDIGSYCGPAMDIDWMTGEELSQAIPPAYTEFIGRQLLAAVEGRAAA